MVGHMTVKLYQGKKKNTQALNGFHAATSAEVGLKLSHLGGSVVIHPSQSVSGPELLVHSVSK